MHGHEHTRYISRHRYARHIPAHRMYRDTYVVTAECSILPIINRSSRALRRHPLNDTQAVSSTRQPANFRIGGAWLSSGAQRRVTGQRDSDGQRRAGQWPQCTPLQVGTASGQHRYRWVRSAWWRHRHGDDCLSSVRSRSNKAKTGTDTGQGPPTTSLPLHDSQPPSGLSFTFQGAALRGVVQMPWAQTPLARVPRAWMSPVPTGAVSEACQATTAGQGDATRSWSTCAASAG